MKAFIVYPTYTVIDNVTYVQLFGKLENGQSFVTINKFKPYLYVKTKETKELPKEIKPISTKLKSFSLSPVSKIEFNTRAELTNFYKKFHKEVEIFEGDIRPQNRFLMDNNLLGTINIEGDHESSEKIDRVYKNPKITPRDFKPDLKIASIDIETDQKRNLFCIGITSKDYKKCFMITSQELKNTVSCANVPDCLEKFKAEITKFDPDIIIGWNVIDFDFKVLRDLYREHKIPFDIGRTNEEIKLRIESGFFRSSSIDIPGRQVLDGLNLIKDPFIKEAPSIKNKEIKSLSLESVAQSLLGEGKLLKGKGRHNEIEELYKSKNKKDVQKLVDYNLLDCELVYDIIEKMETLDLAVERSQLTGLPLDRLSGSIAAFDSLYIREANSRGLVSPSMNFIKKEERITGGYVQSLDPGIYKNVVVLDFKSLYPSIIKTFNIDPSSFHAKCQKGDVKAPNGACFSNTQGILPEIIHKLHQAREKAKKEKRELSNYAIKIIMNSFFGVLASPNCRYFSLDMANAITHFGQFLIKLTAKEIEKDKFKVIYSDTDSVFVETSLSEDKANALGNRIEKEINKFYRDYVKKEHKRESFLELEFEKQYLSMIIPQVRSKTGGAAKKRYAGLKVLPNNKEEIEVVGLEAIRGDWTVAAQEFQMQLLDKIFHEEPIEKFIKSYVKKIKDGKLDEKLIYKKSIRKSLEEYTKTTPPHVKAARKLPKLESNVITYYVTLDGPEPTQALKHKIDYSHYIEKQIKPIAEQILVLINKDFKDLAEDSKQTKLF